MAPNHSPSDHSHGQPAELSTGSPSVPPTLSGSLPVPVAEPILAPEPPVGLTPQPNGEPGLPFPLPIPPPGIPDPWPRPEPWPWPPKLCFLNLREGCYRINFTPGPAWPFPVLFQTYYHGTMRVNRSGGQLTVSGDLYRFRRIPVIDPTPDPFFPLVWPLGIPIYSRSRYYSYLRITNVKQSPIFSFGPCQLTLTAEEHVYTQPSAGSFNGTFALARTVTIVLEPKPAPPGFSSSYFEGRLVEGGVDRGTFTMGWVSSYFRRATLEIDTLAGAVAPAAVGTEDFRTVFATAGWDLRVVYNEVNVPVPTGVTPTNCWSNANLHNLMTTVRNPATNLDAEWRMHLIVVPAQLGCARGVMYDQISVPREGVASFSDDGYPSGECATFGTAANQQQRDIPRAFLRSASHEVGHGFNQIHQEQEGGADNSIMTTTPSVCGVLGGPTTGDPGVFPDDIALRFNDHVRHHLIHFPDIVVRPGGMTFGSGHNSTVPEADRYYFPAEQLELLLNPAFTQIELGEPLPLAWELINHANDPIPVPTDLRTEAYHSLITVTNPQGTAKLMPSFVIQTEQATIQPLEPGGTRSAETRVFWSTHGFAFEMPGKHTVELRVTWTYQGAPVGVRARTDVWVNFPLATADNDAAAVLLDPQVGMYVALGGGATHLTDAVARLEQVFGMAEGDQPAPKALRGYEGLLSSE